ncbi:MAG: peptidoglycan DD-metalloendopeptidase family protein, partial [Acidobacteriota bacterium]
EELAAAQRDLTVTQAALAQTLTRAAALRDVAEKERPDVNSRLVQLYKLGRAGYWRLLLDLDSVQSVGRAYRTASALGRLDRERVQQYQRTLTALAAERRALETHARDIARLKEQAVNARAAMDRAVAARKTLVDSIDAHRDLNAQLTGELESAQQRLQGAVATLGGAPAVSVSLPLRPFRGVLPWPATGIVTGRFGVQTVNRFGATIARNGVEISIAEGKPVRAIHEGLVAYAEPFTGYGNLVIIDHGDGAFSLYGNLASLGVSRGERVDQQAPVGTSGRNPSGNPALYFELRVDGKPVDPLQWLKR